ncbi:hypothetical protein D8B26_003716 [Coccidioides posadasii str. Silveira]|uniref:ATP-dependent protease La domain containing protein n=1 Tax=Coccidioides posadasii (strain C735) TaxID=222929 RepID=C5P061_COCP7|nr:ATP-dependent protease La domain containing protein [Coccidioides posadasii C735 delta SOWgp]EER29706.1 ATP-dependent protease La domain containing protein [Coccidioides posadasii C735 delta SOWgp]QVM09048.1 hypothetical protein D8B26_003716 [Coccidioides posadasii str. Silveira]|eukprot:XP_003071851.1 ATP-dependent protease La domain containing protein [Coccidioides posadasii C735 delta SOWgp]
MASNMNLDNTTPSVNELREIIRLIQCRLCSRLLKSPVRLPCQETVCQGCLPPSHTRKHITYPIDKEREQGFYCTLKKTGGLETNPMECRAEHSLADCGLVVALDKVIENIAGRMNKLFLSNTVSSHDTAFTFETVDPTSLGLKLDDQALPLSSANGSTFAAMYRLAGQGQLPYDANITYVSQVEPVSSLDQFELEVFRDVQRSIKNELDCHICLALMVDPCTTPCGHSFCRLCLARILNHSDLCPVCRRKLSGYLHSSPVNLRLDGLISSFFPEQLAERKEALKVDGNGELDETNVPLFICTLAYPSTRTFLYVFEPRYRLMIRRVMESGNRRFGIVAPKSTASTQEDIADEAPFMEYGTVVEIDRFSPLPDGRCIIRSTGKYRFKVLESTVVDGYAVGKVERVEDVSIAQEEAYEASETGLPVPVEHDPKDEIDRLSTHRLFQIGLTYVAKCRASKATWLDDRIYKLYGPPPPDLRTFSYWFANVLPRPEDDRYSLLPVTTARDRLKIITRWIKKLESGEWALKSPYTIPRADLFLSAFRPVSSSLVATLQVVLGTLFVPVLLLLIYKFATKGSDSFPGPSSISFSILPFAFSFTYTYQSSSPPSAAQEGQQHHSRAQHCMNQGRGFVNPSFMDREYISKTVVLGAIFVLCISRVVRRVVEVVRLERDRAERLQRREARLGSLLNEATAGRPITFGDTIHGQNPAGRSETTQMTS